MRTIGVGVRKSGYKGRVVDDDIVEDEVINKKVDTLCGECDRCGKEFNADDLYLCDDQILCDDCVDEVNEENGTISDV